MQLHLTQSELYNNPLNNIIMCIKSIEQELQWVRFTRTNIASLFKDVADTIVLIGGSYGLKYQCDCFENREITDYDFIVRVRESEKEAVLNIVRSLVRLDVLSHGYSGNEAYKFNNHTYKGKPAEIIIVPMDDEGFTHSARQIGRIWEKPANIIKAKEGYIEDYTKKGLKPRKKDVDDVDNYYVHEELPF